MQIKMINPLFQYSVLEWDIVFIDEINSINFRQHITINDEINKDNADQIITNVINSYYENILLELPNDLILSYDFPENSEFIWQQ